MKNSGAAFLNLLSLLLLGFGLAQSAFACHDLSAAAAALQREADSRIFVLDMQLTKSGMVRSVQVLMGAGPLRTKAIQAATRRKYFSRREYSPAPIAVEVKFPRDKNRPPAIHEITLGVPSCVYVYGGTPIWPLIPWVNQLMSSLPVVPIVPVVPVPDPEGTSK